MNTDLPERIAAIDIGTNSIHLLVARVTKETGGFEVLDHDKEVVRLGAGIGPNGELTDDAIDRALFSIKKFHARAKASGASMRIVATSAVREATNREFFLERVRKELGATVEVASGFEEARLTYLAVRKAVDTGTRSTLMIDIGGGSTEFVVGKGDDVLYCESLKLGAVKLTTQFFPNGKPDLSSIAECREFCTLSFAPVRRQIAHETIDFTVGSSGTIKSIGRMSLFARGESPGGVLNGVSFTADELGVSIEKILRAKDGTERARLEGVKKDRADIIVAGAILLESILNDLNIPAMTISEYSIREGILFDTISRSL